MVVHLAYTPHNQCEVMTEYGGRFMEFMFMEKDVILSLEALERQDGFAQDGLTLMRQVVTTFASTC